MPDGMRRVLAMGALDGVLVLGELVTGSGVSGTASTLK
jgi:hypothetical protein